MSDYCLIFHVITHTQTLNMSGINCDSAHLDTILCVVDTSDIPVQLLKPVSVCSNADSLHCSGNLFVGRKM